MSHDAIAHDKNHAQVRDTIKAQHLRSNYLKTENEGNIFFFKSAVHVNR